jgi:hypothetical protein
LYSEEELKAKCEEWLKDANTDPIKQERIKTIEALLRDVPYKSAEQRTDIVRSFAASNLDIPFIVDYAQQVKKAQGIHGHYR